MTVAIEDVAKDDVTPVGTNPIVVENEDQLAQLMADDPKVYDQVMRDLAEMPEVVPDEESAPEVPDEPEIKPEEKAGEQSDPEASDDKGEKPGVSGGEPPEDKPIADVDVKISPEWLGTYATNRDPREAVEAMHQGNLEKDKTIDYYKLERLPKIETELEGVRRENKELRDSLESVKATMPQSTPEAKLEGDSALPAKPEDIEVPGVPDMPAYPEALVGDDIYDDDKVKLHGESIVKFNGDMRAYNTALRANADARIQQAEVLARGVQSQFEAQREVEVARTAEQQHTQAVQTEYDTLQEMVNNNADVFGQGRSLSIIENDHVAFLKNLSDQAGITGGIYRVEGGQVTNKIRPEVMQTLSSFNSPTSPQGAKLRELCDARGLSEPTDIGVLNNVYAVRRVMNKYRASGMSTQEALAIAKNENPQLDPDRRTKTKVDQAVEEKNARDTAVAQKKDVAKEVQPGDGAAPIELAQVTQAEFAKISLDPEGRSERENQIIRAVVKDGKLTAKEAKAAYDIDL